MLKCTSICAAFVVLGTTALEAQYQKAALTEVELPGAGFHIVLATPSSPAATINLGSSPDALILPLTGGKLALAFEDGRKMIETNDALRHPACALPADNRDDESGKPVAVYVVPKRETSANLWTASLDGTLSQASMRKVEVPRSNLAIVFATTMTPIAWGSHDEPDSITVYSAGSELIMATDGDIEKMFREVGLSQLPMCTFMVERRASNPPQAASVYIVPRDDMTTLTPR
jgi:hypothetical protein